MEYAGRCVEYALGYGAIDFIRRERLEQGMSLAKLLLCTLNLDSGRATVFFPPGLSLEELNRDYDEGFRLPQAPESDWITYTQDDGTKVTAIPTPRADSDLIRMILQHLQASDQNLCVVESPVSEPGHWPPETPGLLFKDEVYFVVQGPSADEGSIRRAVDQADSAWQMFGALTSLPAENAILSLQRGLAIEQLRLMAARTVKLFTPAYDREGYLVWHRD